MLLQRLREYALANLDAPPAHRERGFSWRLDIDAQGRLRRPELQPMSQPDAKGKPRPVPHAVPTAVRTVGVAPNLAADDIQYVLGWGDATTKAPRVQQCHAAFVELVERWADSPDGRDDPIAQAVAAFYRGDEPARVRCDEAFTAKDGVLIVVEETPAYRAPSVVPFWTGEIARRKGSGRTGLCLVCGTVQPLLDTVPGKIPARLVPGASNDAALVSVNERVFGYGLTTQLGASPLCQGCGEAATTGLREVLGSRHATSYGGQDSRLAWWLPRGDDAFIANVWDPNPDHVTAMIAALHNGKPVSAGELDRFCSLTVGGNVARVMVRDWVEMPLADVEKNVAHWFDDHEIVSTWGRSRVHSIRQMMWVLGRWQTQTRQYASFDAKAAHRPSGAHRDLVRAAMRRTPLPPDLLVHLLNRIRSDGHLDDTRAALLRLALVRSPHAQEKPMPDLDDTNPDPAYVAGRLFATYEQIQYDTYGSALNTTYSDRYFAGAMINPRAALVNGRRDAAAWLKKLRRTKPGVAVNHSKRLDALARLVDSRQLLPARMTPRDQAAFLVGYHHQRAHLIPPAAAKAATTDDQETSS